MPSNERTPATELDRVKRNGTLLRVHEAVGDGNAEAGNPKHVNGSRQGNGRTLPLVTLPPRLPKQQQRRTQSNIPNDRTQRDELRRIAAETVADARAIAPLTMDELRALTAEVREKTGCDGKYDDYLSVVINNEAWRDSLARVPYDRRLLLLPKCLRVEELCPAPFDEFGLLCKECGLCSLHDLTVEAERLGYAVLVAEGSALVRQMIETGHIEAIVGVSCLNVLEKCFTHLEAAAVPGVAIPLLQDDCVNTSVDLDWVWDLIHVTSDDKTYRLDLDALRADVDRWFELDSLASVMGAPHGRTEKIAQEWMARDGKRWRPYLTACVYMALASENCDARPAIPADLAKLGVAVECFHKASLIHDDIEDHDDLRYGQRSLHAEYGMPVALNVGDFLLGEGYRLVGELDVPAAATVEMLRIAAEGHLTLSRGQGAELCWTDDPQPLSSLEVLDIFRQKTAPAFEVALRLGAVYGGATEEIHGVLSEYSESLGIAYQIRDDLEDHTGESDSHDLQDLRPSLLLAIARKRAANKKDRDLVTSLWERRVRYADVADDVLRIFNEAGVVTKTTELLEAYREQATRSLRFVPNATLKGLLRRVVGKIFPQTLIEGYCSEFEARNASSGASGAEHAA